MASVSGLGPREKRPKGFFFDCGGVAPRHKPNELNRISRSRIRYDEHGKSSNQRTINPLQLPMAIAFGWLRLD